MSEQTLPTFRILQACWDPDEIEQKGADGAEVMWVVVQSEDEVEGEFIARLWFSVEHDDPTKGTLAEFDPRALDDAPEDAEPTTVLRGLKANRCAFGIPWLARKQGVTDQRVQIGIQVVPASMADDWDVKSSDDSDVE